jgi:nucleoside-diphosphate-sugar epimerase
MMSKPVFVTGADGFVGRAVCRALVQAGIPVRPGVRVSTGDGACRAYGDLRAQQDFLPYVAGCDAVIHLAGKVHARGGAAADEAGFHSVNVDATGRLAHAAATAGVRRFVFASTLGVHATMSAARLRAQDAISPETPYAQSKWRAEQLLQALHGTRGMETVVIRPPLVYGPQCPGNMARLARLVAKDLPLPFGSVHNLRSFIDVENLAQAFVAAIRAPEAGGRAFLVSDGEDVSLVQTLRFLAEGMGKMARLFPVPPALLQGVAFLAGKGGEMSKLIDSLIIDNEAANIILGFVPSVGVADGLRRTGRSFQTTQPGM